MRMNVFRLGGFCAALLTGAAVDCAAADPVTVNVESGVDVDIEDAVVLETLISSDAYSADSAYIPRRWCCGWRSC